MLGDDPICPTCDQDFASTDVVHRYPGEDLSLAAMLFGYGGRVAQAVRRLKYNRSTSLADPLSGLIAEGQARLGLTGYDFVVPIPIHWSRRSTRGFNQSDLLASRLDRVDPRALARIRRTKAQAGLTHEQRLINLEGAFRASPRVLGRTILLVDDVLTSGQTARECAKALRSAGATDVAILALAGEGASRLGS